MRKILFILLSCICISSFSQQITTAEKEKECVLKNGIKTISQYSHKFVKGEPSPEGVLISKSLFDQKGNLIEKISYNREGKETLILKYKYDQNDQKVEFYSLDINEKSTLKQSFVYRNGNKISETINEEIVSDSKTVNIDFLIKYIYKDNKLSSIVKTDKATFEKTNTWNYTYQGNKIIEEEFDVKNTPIKTTESIYDKNNQLIKETLTYLQKKNAKGEVLSISTSYKYNQNGLQIEAIKQTNTSLTEKVTYEYDNNNNIIEIAKEIPNKTPYVDNIYEYDTKENLKKESWYEGDPQKYSKKTMKYDSKGILLETVYLYAKYNYQVLYTYKYTFY